MQGDLAELVTLDSVIGELLACPAWHQRAACRGKRTDMFFRGQGYSLEPARAICDGCTVREPCLNDALEAGNTTSGIWARMSQQERKGIHRQRALGDAA